MTRIALGAGAVALVITMGLPAVAATSSKAEMTTASSMVQTAAKGAKGKSKSSGKSCGTMKYTDKKTGKCLDARDKAPKK